VFKINIFSLVISKLIVFYPCLYIKSTYIS